MTEKKGVTGGLLPSCTGSRVHSELHSPLWLESLFHFLFILHSFAHYTLVHSFIDSFIQPLVTVFCVQSIMPSPGWSESPRPERTIISQAKLGSRGEPFPKVL